MEESIERYIQFALDNWFDMHKFVSELEKFSKSFLMMIIVLLQH